MIRNTSRKLHTVCHFYNGRWYNGLDKIRINSDIVVSDGLSTPINYGTLNLGHNPFLNTHMYSEYGNICGRLSKYLNYGSVHYNYLVNSILKVYPKSIQQIEGELNLTRQFLTNLSGDNIQYILRGKSMVGDYNGQQSTDWRFPYGRVCVITPFNFPIEIPVLQTISALVTGNIPMLHVDPRVAYPMEYFIKLMLDAGVPENSFMFINGMGKTVEKTIVEYNPSQTIFTGSSHVARHLVSILGGRVKVEDSGFNWKYLGSDCFNSNLALTNKILDRSFYDAYENYGQKCSSQRLLFVPNNKLDIVINHMCNYFNNSDILSKIYAPLMSVTSTDIKNYLENVDMVLQNDTKIYTAGHGKPTVIVCDIENFRKNIKMLDTEIFAPIQFLCPYTSLHQVKEIVSNIRHQLTCAIVTNNITDREELLSVSKNGTTYVGLNARTTGTLQNRWFGPGGDPLAGSIGTPESIRDCWTFNRCIISDSFVKY